MADKMLPPRKQGGSTIPITTTLPKMCIERLICTPKSPNPTSSWLCPTINGTAAINPMMPDRSAAASHNE